MSTPGCLSSQNQTRKFARISPTVTYGVLRPGTLSRSGSIGPQARGSARGERLADPVADGGELERLARHLAEELVGRRLLALRPQFAEQRAGLAAREPGVAEALPEMGPQLCLEGPRAKVLRRIEAVVDVAEVVGRCRLDLRGIGEEIHVPGLQRGQILGSVELELVQELRAVAP